MQISDTAVQRMIFLEPGLTLDQKQVLMDQVRELSSENGSPNISMSEIVGSGVGSLAGYMAAKSIGAGPVLSAAAAVLGGMGGGALTKPIEDDGFNPGFYIPY